MNKLFKTSIPILLIAGLLLGAGCAAAPTEEMVAPEMVAPTSPTLPPAPMRQGMSVDEGSYESYKDDRTQLAYEPTVTMSTVGQPWATERMIVRTGNISLLAEDIPAAVDRIIQFTKSLGGYVVSSKTWRERERLIGTIAIRVPAEHFDDAMGKLRELAVEVVSESTSSKDVTEEYVDLSAKLKNLEVAEKQLLKLMEQAKTVEEILNVQRELTKTRGEIEQTKGRMEYLEQTSATSLIEVSLEQANLEVEFSANKASLKTGEKIRFSSQVAGGFSPYSYDWDFGDGDTSTDNNPIHYYRSAGKYTVSLKVTDDRGGEDTEIREDYITVLPSWSPGNVSSVAWNALVTFGRVLANVFIWIGIFSPVWIVVGGILFWWFRRRRKAL